MSSVYIADIHSERKRFLHNEVKPIGAILSSQIQGLSNFQFGQL